MKITEKFIDCVYESNLYGEDLNKIKMALFRKLPDKRIAELSNILMIDTINGMYAIKIRMIEFKPDGTVDVEKIHKNIMESDFIEITRNDFKSIKDYKDFQTITDKLITLGANVIFRMKDVDVNKLHY